MGNLRNYYVLDFAIFAGFLNFCSKEDASIVAVRRSDPVSSSVGNPESVH